MHMSFRRRRLMVRNGLIAGSVLAVAVLFGVPAKSAEFQRLAANSYGQVEFSTPSGNIGCIYTPTGGTPVYSTSNGQAEIQCDRVEPNYVRAILGAEGGGVVVGEVGDPSCCSLTQQLNYDSVVQLGLFQCLSERRGLTCARSDGHGFFLSRAKIEVR